MSTVQIKDVVAVYKINGGEFNFVPDAIDTTSSLAFSVVYPMGASSPESRGEGIYQIQGGESADTVTVTLTFYPNDLATAIRNQKKALGRNSTSKAETRGTIVITDKRDSSNQMIVEGVVPSGEAEISNVDNTAQSKWALSFNGNIIQELKGFYGYTE